MSPLLTITIIAVILSCSLMAYVIGHRNGIESEKEESELRKPKGKVRKLNIVQVNGWEFKPKTLNGVLENKTAV